MKAVADLQRVRCASGDALSIGGRAVPAHDLHSRMLAEPSAERLGAAALPQGEREPGANVDQQGAVRARVQDEVVHAQHPRCDRGRQWHSHQVKQHTRARQRCVQDAQQPCTTAAGQENAECLHQVLQQRRAALVAHRQSVNLLDEGDLHTGRVLTVQAPYAQVDTDRPATESGIGEVAHITAVDPIAHDTATRTACGHIAVRAGLDDHGGAQGVHRGDGHRLQVR
jgi:hypothetical protein